MQLHRPRSRSVVSVCLALALTIAPAYAQPALEIKVSSSEAYTNETVTVQVSIFNYKQAERPDFPELPGCIVRGGSEQSSINFDGREMRNSVRYSYEVVANKPGEVTIPPIAVSVDGRTLKTDPVKLRFLAGESSDLFQAEITCSTRRLYVGQNVRFVLTLYVKPAALLGQVANRSTMKEYVDRAWGTFGNFRYTGRESSVKRAGSDGREQTFYSYEYVYDAILEQPGPLPFADLLVGIDYPKFERDPFGGARVSKYRKLRNRPTVEVPDVLALPAAGRPATFSGAVGVFRLDVSAKPTNVRVGDPIELTMSLTGAGPLESLPPPNLKAQAALNEQFRVPDEALAGRVENGRRLFTQSIRARRSDVIAIPPIEFSFFDPDRGEYATAASSAIPIRVEASNSVDAASLPELAPQTPAKAAAPEAVDGLRGNDVDEARLLNSIWRVQIWHIATVTLAPPLVFLASWLWTVVAQLRAASPAAQRRQMAYSVAQQRISDALQRPHGETGHALAAVLAGYLADRLHQPPGRFVGASAIATLRELGMPAALIARCDALRVSFEQAAFAGGAGVADPQVDELRQVLTELEKCRL